MMIEPFQDPRLSAGQAPQGAPVGVVNPYNGETIGEIAAASERNVENVLAAAAAAVKRMRSLSAH